MEGSVRLRKRHRRFGIDTLEPRVLLSGNIPIFEADFNGTGNGTGGTGNGSNLVTSGGTGARALPRASPTTSAPPALLPRAAGIS